MENTKKTLNQSANDMKDNIGDAGEANDNDKEGTSKSDKLFRKLCDSIIELMEEPGIQQVAEEMSKKLDEDTALTIITMITKISVVAAYNAISFHHDIIIDMMDESIEGVARCMTEVTADQSATKDAVVVLRKRIEEIYKDITIGKMSNK